MNKEEFNKQKLLSLTEELEPDVADVGGQCAGAAGFEGGELLSEREAQIIKQVARGHTNHEIADKLSLSVKTVETYRARAMEKLGLSSRAALVRYAMEQGWLNE